MNDMRILIGVHHFPPNYSGGAEGRSFRTAMELINQGHEVQVLCVEKINDFGFLIQQETYEGLNVHRISMPAPFNNAAEYNNAAIADYLRILLHEYQPDIFHLFSGYLLSGSVINVADQMNTPIVISLTDFWYFCPRITFFRTDGTLSKLPLDFVDCVECLNRSKRRYRLMEKLLPGSQRLVAKTEKTKQNHLKQRYEFLKEALGKADCLIAPSNFLRDMYLQSGIQADLIIYMRQGIDIAPVNEKQAGTDKGKFRVGFIGQIAKHKGVQLLIDTVPLLGENIQILIFGDVDQHPEFGREIISAANASDSIQIKGVINGPKPDLYDQVDCVVVPSIWYENSPNVIIEAQTYHKPVIASDMGGMKEMIVEGVTGELFPVGDSLALADVINRVIHNFDAYNFSDLPYYSVEEEVSKLVDIYRKVQTDDE